jgi:ABC-type antimicrobial peptide transport system permease subunit
MALGAESGKVLLETLRSGLFQIGLGLVLGGILALLLVSVLGGLFHQTDPLDRTVWGLVMAIMVATGFLASWIPALRAVRTDPVSALGGG